MSATVHRFPHSPPRLRVVNGADVEARRRETLGSDENGPMLVLTWWDGGSLPCCAERTLKMHLIWGPPA